MKSKKCATGVKKMTFKKYEQGTKNVKPKAKSFTDKALDAVMNPAEDIRYGLRKMAGESPDYMDKQSQARKTKQYAEGSKGIKGFISKLKGKQNSSDADAYATDAGDEILRQVNRNNNNAGNVTPNENNSSYNEESFVGPVRTGLDAAADNVAKEASYPTTPPSKLNNNVSKGADAKLAAWQRKRGLKDDGLWGKESAAAYKKEQDAKMNKSFSKTTVSKTTYPGQLHNTSGYQKPSNTDFYNNKAGENIMRSNNERGVGRDANGEYHPTVVKRNSITERKNKPAPSVVGYSRDVNQRYADGTMPKRYDSMGGEISKPTMSPKLKKGWTPPSKFAEGTSGVTTKKKMEFVGPGTKEQEEGRAAEKQYEITKSAETARDAYESGKPSSSLTAPKSTTPAGKTEGVDWNNKAEMDKVKAYQTKHGLKADGVWGKDTAKYYEDSQKAKKSSTPSGSTRGAAVKSTTGTSTTPKVAAKVTTNTGKGLTYKEGIQKDNSVVKVASNGDQYYENGRVRRASGKMENARPDELKDARRQFSKSHGSETLGKVLNSGNKTRKRDDDYLDDAVDIGARVLGSTVGGTAGTFLAGPAGTVAGGMAGDYLGKKVASRINHALGYEKENDSYTKTDAVLGAVGGVGGQVASKVAGKVLPKLASKALGGTSSKAGQALAKVSSKYANAAAPKVVEEGAETAVKRSMFGKAKDKAASAVNKLTGNGSKKATTAAENKAMLEAEELAATQSNAASAARTPKATVRNYDDVSDLKVVEEKPFGRFGQKKVKYVHEPSGKEHVRILDKQGKVVSKEKALALQEKSKNWKSEGAASKPKEGSAFATDEQKAYMAETKSAKRPTDTELADWKKSKETHTEQYTEDGNKVSVPNENAVPKVDVKKPGSRAKVNNTSEAKVDEAAVPSTSTVNGTSGGHDKGFPEGVPYSKMTGPQKKAYQMHKKQVSTT